MAAEASPPGGTSAEAVRSRSWETVAFRAVSALVVLAFLLPLHAAASLPSVGSLLVVLASGLCVLSASRPVAGLAALLLLLPGAVWVEPWSGGALGGEDVVDLFVLAFVAGATVRLPGQRGTSGRLLVPAAVLGVAILTSTVAELRALQAVTPRDPLWPDLWHFLTVDYWSEPHRLQVVRHTWRWMAWLAAAVFAERIIGRSDGTIRGRLFATWLASGVLGAAIVVHRMLTIALGQPEGFWPALAEIWRHVRLSVLQPDVNAAGSHLLLFLVPAAVVGLARRNGWIVGACVPTLLLAFGLARSRAAIGAGVVVGCAVGLVVLWRRRSAAYGRVVPALLVVVMGLAILMGTWRATSGSHAAIGDATEVRLDLARAGAEALRRNPVFGVGLSDYIPATRRFVTPEMEALRAMAPNGENAHNNFLQIAVELGLPACVLFLWFVAVAVRPALTPTDGRLPMVAQGMALGVLAFLISALFGHPLLVPLVGTAFFMALGLTAGLASPVDRRASWVEPLSWMVAGGYLGSLVWRW